MEEIKKVAIGAILHDIGKVCYRSGDGRNHSISGNELISKIIDDKDILESIKYHHASLLKNANISDTSNAYITYIADNIASGTDRRKSEGEESGFVREMPLSTVFNILNNSNNKATYSCGTLEFKNGINFPTVKDKSLTTEFYNKILINIVDALKHSELTNVNSLMEIMEANLSYVPSSTNTSEVADISLFDHSKLTAGLAICIKKKLDEDGVTNNKEKLFTNAEKFYNEKSFLIYSFDLSGIQNFLYTVGKDNVLKALRTRSFYLEILAEHIADELLAALNLYRTNLIYTGGGHAYMLLPNTVETKNIIEAEAKKINDWFLSEFNTDLYMAYAYEEASANEFMNKEQGQYANLYKELSKKLGEKKLNRYDAKAIRFLNSTKIKQDERECKVCHRTDNLNDESLCVFCNNFITMSNEIINNKYFAVLERGNDYLGLELPNNKILLPVNEDKLLNLIKSDKVIRFYVKNSKYTGSTISTSLWMGDYTTKSTFNEFAEVSCGIKRIGVLRADVDNLGKAFTNGFDEKYNTISRTSTFSRQLSLFFKLNINKILSGGIFHLRDEESARMATVVYSGGDDMFIVGSFDSIVELALDINREFKKFALGTLTLSAGIGIFSDSYPLIRIAKEVLALEDLSKTEGKNRITLFDTSKDHTYTWEEFESQVINEKYRTIENYFDTQEEHGKSTIYKMIEYIRDEKDKNNVPRLLYLIARLKPDSDNTEDIQRYKEFTDKIYDWIIVENKEARRQLLTALYLYVYLTRGENDG